MSDDGGESGDAASSMLARTWVIAANYRTPADYGIPTAPRFRAERGPDGTLVCYPPGGDDPVLWARHPAPVRR